VKPVYPKEEWHKMSADPCCKVFKKMERPIFDDKLDMFTITATDLEALDDAVAVQTKLNQIKQHFKQNDLMCTLEVVKYDPKRPRDFTQHSSVNMIEEIGTYSPRDVVTSFFDFMSITPLIATLKMLLWWS